MKQIKTLLACCTTLWALSACTDGQETGENDGHRAPADAVALTVNTPPQTRAADVAYQPASTVDLHLYNGSLQATGAQTAVYNYTSGQWEAKAQPLYWEDMEANANGIYSFYARPGDGNLQVAADQTTEDNYLNSDFLLGYTYTTQRREPLVFTLKHLLAQLNVTLLTKDNPATTWDERFSEAQLAQADIRAGSLSVTYDLALSPADTKDEADAACNLPATVTAGTGATDVQMLRTLVYNEPGNATSGLASVMFSLIAPPQTLGNIVISIGGQSYTYDASHISLTTGYSTDLALTVTKSALTPGTVNVTPWKEDLQGNHPATTDDIVTPVSSLTDLTEAGMLTLWAYKADDSGNIASGYTPDDDGKGAYPVIYSSGKSDIDTDAPTYAPILWEDLDRYTAAGSGTLQKYIYTAFFSPSATPPANQESDYLAGQSAATLWGTAPDFSTADNPAGSGNGTKLHHLMARLEVNVSFGSEFSAAEKDGARMTTVRNRKVEKIKDDYTGVELATVGTGTPEEIATATVVLGKHAESNGSYTFAAILAPQTLDMGAGKFLALTLNEGTAQENRYSMSDTGGLTLEAGVRYIYTVTVSKSGLAVGKLEIEPWNDRTGSGSFDWE